MQYQNLYFAEFRLPDPPPDSNVSEMKMQENYQTILNSAGLRPSAQRVAIYAYLCEHGGHPTADAVYKALSQEHPTLSKTTVYNTLRLFEEKNLVRTLLIEEGKLLFDAEMRPHIHFKCRRCGKIFDLYNDAEIAAHNEKFAASLPRNFSADKIQTNIWGLCEKCRSADGCASV